MSIQNTIYNNKNDLAFLIGNGINLYKSNGSSRTRGTIYKSWREILVELWHDYIGDGLVIRRGREEFPEGITYPEIFDLIEMSYFRRESLVNEIQKKICEDMKDWTPTEHHKNFTKLALQLNAPVLTTNYDHNFVMNVSIMLMKLKGYKSNDFYPWSKYYGKPDILDYPTNGFGVWHIHGLIDHPRSLRIGLSHYAGAIQKARYMIHKGDDSLFTGKNVHNWTGSKTWLHIVFNKSIMIAGLSLETNETFLRWLLLERKRYFDKFPARNHNGWYIVTKADAKKTIGRTLFLKNAGFELIEIDEWGDFYETSVNSLLTS